MYFTAVVVEEVAKATEIAAWAEETTWMGEVNQEEDD